MTDTLKDIRKYLGPGRKQKFSLSNPHITPGKKRRIKKMIQKANAGGKFIFLPFDHGVEHGPSDFFVSPGTVDPEFQLSLAKEAGFSGVAIQVGLAEKYWKKPKYKKHVPLVLKLNGKTNIPPADEAISPLTATVKDAVLLGATAVGYTLYVGTPRQDEDFIQFLKVRQEANEADLPIIMWAYPRGKYAINEYGGKSSFAMVDYAARLANELGADFAKIPFPAKPDTDTYKDKKYEKYNDLLSMSGMEMLSWCIASAGSTGVFISGGSKISDEDMLDKVKQSMQAGANGLLFGRNIWQREYDDALAITKKVKEVLRNG